VKAAREFSLLETYQRDLGLYPLLPGESGEEVNLQEGKCNSFNYRKNGGEPHYIMQHYTVLDAERAIKTFTTTNVRPASANYVVFKNGVVEEFVAPEYRAYHAGIGNLSGGSKLNPAIPNIVDDMDSWSIGIENVNSGFEPFTQEQIEANVLLCQKLCKTYKSINPKLMLGHSDWSLGNKFDPGVYFPWKDFANASEKFEYLGIEKDFGVFPQLDAIKTDPTIFLSYTNPDFNREDLECIQTSLREIGYAIPDEDLGTLSSKTSEAILAFLIHYRADKILNDEVLLEALQVLSGGAMFDEVEEYAKTQLIQFDENDFECMIDVLGQLD
jgi:hypothetical protein